MLCTICNIYIGIIDTFIGCICMDCDRKTTKLAEEKLKTWKLPRFEKEETFYCGICELEHELNNTSCVQPNPDDVLINYEDKHNCEKVLMDDEIVV